MTAPSRSPKAARLTEAQWRVLLRLSRSDDWVNVDRIAGGVWGITVDALKQSGLADFKRDVIEGRDLMGPRMMRITEAGRAAIHARSKP